jgi:hypothetical protein
VATTERLPKYGVAAEINAHPWRLDLDWRWHQAPLDFGFMMSINPDAHSVPEPDHMHWGVEMARKGGVPAARVLNAMKLSDITRDLKHRRSNCGAPPEKRTKPERPIERRRTAVWRVPSRNESCAPRFESAFCCVEFS